MNLFDLPPEIIERIIRLAMTHTKTYADYCRRQDLLRSLCLVHSFLRQISQPLLDETLWIPASRGQGWWNVIMPRATRQKLGRLRNVSTPDTLEKLWVAAPYLFQSEALRSVRLEKLQMQDLVWVERCSALRCLRLTLESSTGPYPAVSFPSVSELELILKGNIDNFLSPATFPSLRHLALSSSTDAHTPPLDTIFPQLSTLTLSLEYITTRSVIPRVDHSCKILRRLDLAFIERVILYRAASPLFEHEFLCFDFSEGRDDADFAQYYVGALCTTFLAQPRFSLTHLYLPACASPAHIHSPDLALGVTYFLDVLEQRDIVVEFEDCEEMSEGALFLPKFEAHVE